jgi:hypothetical protein
MKLIGCAIARADEISDMTICARASCSRATTVFAAASVPSKTIASSCTRKAGWPMRTIVSSDSASGRDPACSQPALSLRGPLQSSACSLGSLAAKRATNASAEASYFSLSSASASNAICEPLRSQLSERT